MSKSFGFKNNINNKEKPLKYYAHIKKDDSGDEITPWKMNVNLCCLIVIKCSAPIKDYVFMICNQDQLDTIWELR